MEDVNTFETSDLSIAAFLVMRDYTLLSARKGPTGRFEFVIADPDRTATALALQYINSDFCKFDNAIRNVKKILYKN